MFTARGYLAGSLRFGGLAVVTFGEAAIRLAVVVLALLMAVPAVPAFALAAFASAWVGLPILITRMEWTAGSSGCLPR